ncbi:MAG: starch-binding protein [Bacteroidaceae bacterium]|nr:starch-binding protein [Bacteroidaceae bacterium]
MKKITTFLLALLLTIPAMAATVPAGEKIYMTGFGDSDGAQFGAYFFGSSGNAWASADFAAKNSDGYYEFTVPAGGHTSVIFVRFGNSATVANSWNNKWNQTKDLTLDDSKRLFTVTNLNGDACEGSWSTYTPSAEEPEIIEPSYLEGEIVAFFDNTTKKYNTVYAYVWNDSGNNSWPGEKCENLGNNIWKWKASGNFATTQPNNIIFNNGSGSQTADLIFEVGGVYDGSKTTYSKKIEPTVPVSATITLNCPSVVYVNEEVTLKANTYNTENLTNPTIVYNIDGQDIANDKWTPSVAGTAKIVAILKDNGEEIARSEVANVTIKEKLSFDIYLLVEGAWEETNIHCWGGYTTEWPGETLTEKETINGKEYWKKSFTNLESAVNLLFNNKSNNKNKTGDITNVASTTYYRLSGTVYTESETPFEGEIDNTPKLYILGLDSWTASESNAMTYNEETSTFSWEGVLTTNDQFSFNDGGDNWYGFSYFTNLGDYPLKAGGEYVTDFIYTGAEASVTITVDLTNKKLTLEGAKFVENILCEDNYYLRPGNAWNNDGAWFAAYFFNKNTDAHTWVKGELFNDNTNGDAIPTVVFYLSKYNVPAAAPARAKAEEDPVYTHVIFVRMNSEATEMSFDGKWDQTEDLTYPTESGYKIYEVDVHGAGEGKAIGEWVNYDSVPTGLEAVEADGMVYAGNVVAAEGAIEVYNLSGAVVARGNNRVDLNGLAGGVYVVRCGNDVLKVVR